MTYIIEILNNVVLWTALVSWAVAQLFKVAIEFAKVKRFDVKLLTSSGGMPSSHTSTVTALATSIGIKEGFNSVLFAVCAIVSCVVMYDAAGVRRAAGKQAEVINIIVENIENTGIVVDKKLKELLGHTPVEVACGALLGVLIAFLMT